MSNIKLPGGHKWHDVPSSDATRDTFACKRCQATFAVEFDQDGGFTTHFEPVGEECDDE